MFKLETYVLTAFNNELVEYIDDNATLIAPFAFFDQAMLITVNCPSCRYVNRAAFYACSNLLHVCLDNTEIVGEYAFGENSSLTSISLPKAKKVGQFAFADCASLAHIDLPSCEEVCGEGAFAAFVGEMMSLPACKTIGISAFMNSESIRCINVPHIESFGKIAASCPNLVSAVMSSLTAVPKVSNENYIMTPAFENVHNDFKIYVNSSIYNEMTADSYWNKFFADKIVAI